MLKFGLYATPMRHWQDDTLYVRAPTRLTYDWLVTFTGDDLQRASTLTVQHVGWDKTETDHTFQRVDSSMPRSELKSKNRVAVRFELGDP